MYPRALPHLPVGQQAESKKRQDNEWCSGAQSYIPEICRAGNCMMSCGFGPIKLQVAFTAYLLTFINGIPTAVQAGQNKYIHDHASICYRSHATSELPLEIW